MNKHSLIVLLVLCLASSGCSRFIKPDWDAPIFEGELQSNDSGDVYDVSFGVEKFSSMKGTRAYLYMAYRDLLIWKYLRLVSVAALREERFQQNVSELGSKVVAKSNKLFFSFNGSAFVSSSKLVKGRVTVVIHIVNGRARIAQIRFAPDVPIPGLEIPEEYSWKDVMQMSVEPDD